MTPDEVIAQLKSIFDIEISRATLLRYEKQELIPLPKRGGGGTGGRWTDYPPETTEQAFAAWCLLHGDYGSEDLIAFFDGKLPRIAPSVIATVRESELKIDERQNAKILGNGRFEVDFSHLKRDDDTIAVIDIMLHHLFVFVRCAWNISVKFARDMIKEDTPE